MLVAVKWEPRESLMTFLSLICCILILISSVREYFSTATACITGRRLVFPLPRQTSPSMSLLVIKSWKSLIAHRAGIHWFCFVSGPLMLVQSFLSLKRMMAFQTVIRLLMSLFVRSWLEFLMLSTNKVIITSVLFIIVSIWWVIHDGGRQNDTGLQRNNTYTMLTDG